MFNENCMYIKCVIYVFCLVIYIFILQNHYSFEIRVEAMSWNTGFSNNLILEFLNKFGNFLFVLQEMSKK